jgi:outer membrane biosynthesis protein TonB
VSAAALHVALIAFLHGPLPHITKRDDVRVEVTFAPPPAPEAPPTPPALPPPPPPAAPSRTPPHAPEPSIAQQAEAASTERAPEAGERAAAPSIDLRRRADDGESLMRSAIRGTAQGPLPSIATLEAATGVRTPGPESDAARASRLAKANLQRDMSEHDVARGLADDWFRRRSNDVARLWNPSERELIDGGKQVQATELALRTAFNPLLWKEAAEIIAGDASAVAQSLTDLNRARAIEEMMTSKAQPLETAAERRARLHHALTTNKDAFATSVGLEVSVRHRPDGSVETIEVTASSGHQLLDEGAVDAVARALALDPSDKAPPSIARGQPFFTRWSLDVKWALNVPKCSALASGTGAASQMAAGDMLPVGCGTSFGNDGVDVPFTVKKDRRVELISIDRL